MLLLVLAVAVFMPAVVWQRVISAVAVLPESGVPAWHSSCRVLKV